jgi:hypothetical protein
VLKLTEGTGPNTRKTLYTTQSISGIKVEASPNDLIAVAQDLAGLISHPLFAVLTVSTVELLEG